MTLALTNPWRLICHKKETDQSVFFSFPPPSFCDSVVNMVDSPSSCVANIADFSSSCVANIVDSSFFYVANMANSSSFCVANMADYSFFMCCEYDWFFIFLCCEYDRVYETFHHYQVTLRARISLSIRLTTPLAPELIWCIYLPTSLHVQDVSQSEFLSGV